MSTDNILAAASENKIVLWSIKNQVKLCNFPIISSYEIDSIDISSYNNILSAKNIKGNQVIWRISDMPQERIKTKNIVKLALMTDDNNYLITNDEEFNVHIWDLKSK